MHIYPIKSFTINNNQYRNPVFTAHPDFYKFNDIKSCYFRRGVVNLSNNKGYANIENLFCKIFQTDITEPKKMLIIGIGNSQEPFSYLASIKGIIKDKHLNECVDLYTVDLQSKPEQEKLRLNSFSDLFDYETFPQYAGKSFIADEKYLKKEREINSLTPIEHYIYLKTQPAKQPEVRNTDLRVNDEIFDFVYQTYNNPQKSKWDCRIQEVITDYPDEKFDIISANNVLPYITEYNSYLQTLKHINRTLKTNGYIITDPYDFFLKDAQNAGILNNLKQISAGIFQKHNSV